MSRTIRKQKGFTLIELIVVMVVIGIGSAVAIALFNNTRETSQVETETKNIQAIQAKTRDLFAARSDFTGLTSAVLLSANGFPTSMVNGANVTNAWNGAVTVTTATVPAANAAEGQIVYAGVPTSACIALVSKAARSARHINVGATNVKTAAQTNDVLATTTTACGATDPATITMTFGR